MSDWIKCSERLPSSTDDVLVTDGEFQAVGYWTGVYWWPANVDCAANQQIKLDFLPTHWQPLPSPPEE